MVYRVDLVLVAEPDNPKSETQILMLFRLLCLSAESEWFTNSH